METFASRREKRDSKAQSHPALTVYRSSQVGRGRAFFATLPLLGLIALLPLSAAWGTPQRPAPDAQRPKPISYDKQIAPILKAKCQACHQPAAAGGGLTLTDYKSLVKGGEHGPSFQPGKPDASLLMEHLVGKRSLMPKGGPPLASAEIALFRRWIAEGAKDDTPVVKDPIDADHPPVYTKPPIITALTFAPDGKTLAVAGYREALVHQADGSGLVARLVGASQKILSLTFSPDGKLLAAVGGTPALFGEAQFWDAATYKLVNAVKVGYDTLFGASFSPDGKKLAVGAADNSVRLLNVPEGEQTLKFDNHSDWVLATAFTSDNKHFLSTGRDQAIKLVLIEGPTGSFIDDINTHTSPMRCLTRRPQADQVLCGGEDGIPRLYQVFRTKARTMNQEDHNLLRVFERQGSGITALAFSPDGSQIAVGSEAGVVNLYAVGDLKTGLGTNPDAGLLEKPVATLRGSRGAVYAITFHPNGKRLATGGYDGQVRLYDLPSGALVKAFAPVPLSKPTVNAAQK